MLDDLDLERRGFLRATGTVASLSAFGGHALRAADAEPSEVPADERSVEAGLTSFVSKYESLGAVIGATRFGRFLSGREFVCSVAGQPRAWTLSFGPQGVGVEMHPGTTKTADEDLHLDAEDWRAVLYGDYTGLAPVVGGRAFPSRDQANSSVLLLLVMYVAAQLPAGADYDMEYLAESAGGAAERGGLPDCEHAPPGLELRDQAEHEAEGRAREEALGINDAPPVTEVLAEWVDDLSWSDVPDAERERAKAQVTSILGVIYAGSTMDAGDRFASGMADLATGSEATVFGAGFETSAPEAAKTNAYLAGVLEWEDFTYLAHSGAAIVPTALAAAEAADRPVTGRELLTAVVAGNEIIARLGEFLTDVVHAGQALAVHQAELPFVAGKLLGLDAERMQAAAGVAATQPQETTLSSFSAATKSLTTGQPARVAVRACQLADAGVTGRTDVLENPLGYFYRLSDIRSPRELRAVTRDLSTDPAEHTWRFADQHFNKKYPTNGFHLTAVEAAREVRERLPDDVFDADGTLDPSRIEGIDLRVPLVTAATGTMFSEGEQDYIDDRILDPDDPDWTYVALMYDSVWPVVAALYAGELTHRQYREAFLRNGSVRSLYRKTVASTDLSNGVFGASVTVKTGDATVSGTGADEARDGDARGAVADSADGAAETFDGATAPAQGGEFDAGPDEEYSAFVGCIRGGVNEGSIAREKFHTAAGAALSEHERERVLRALERLDDPGYTVEAFVSQVRGN